MKIKKYILLIIVTFSLNCYCQNKTETSDWIIRQINLHTKERHKGTSVIIRNDSIIKINHDYNTFDRMALKDIQSIQINKNKINTPKITEFYYEVKLGRTDKKKLVDRGAYNYGKMKSDNEKAYHEFYLILDEFLDKDEVDDRLAKALLKLTQLNNGNAKIIKETF